MRALGQLDSFTGWPALKVLKISKCRLFEKCTDIHIRGAEVFDVTWLKPGMKSQELHITRAHTSIDDILKFASKPFCVKSLVQLALCGRFESRKVAELHKFTDALKLLLHQCEHLQVLKLNGCFAPLAKPLDIVLNDTHGACLTDLDLRAMLCGYLDLSQAAALSAVVLHGVESGNPHNFRLRLPSNLQSFDYASRGALMCQPSASEWFTSCSNLTSLRVHLDNPSFHASSFELPVLPASLYFLSVFIPDHSMHGCDWHCLRPCSRLEHIELPNVCRVPESLQEWLDTARHLHVLTLPYNTFNVEKLHTCFDLIHDSLMNRSRPF